MKVIKLFPLVFAIFGLNLATTLSAQADGLDDIVINYCEEVLRNVEDTFRGLENAAQDLSRCDDKLDDCTSGVFGGNPASCFADFGRCVADGSTDAQRECSEFSREMTEDTRHAERQSYRDGVSGSFEAWFRRAYSDPNSCLAPARETAALCTAGVQ